MAGDASAGMHDAQVQQWCVRAPHLIVHKRNMRDEPQRQIREWIGQTLESKGWTPPTWAKRAGVSPSTITRAPSPEYDYTPTTKTVAKLAAAADVDAPDVTAPATTEGARLIELPIRHQVAGGAWLASDDVRDEPFGHAMAQRHPPYAAFQQWLERVIGDSVDKLIPPGSLIHVVDAIDMHYEPRHGDLVVVVRTRAQGAFRERTVKQVELRPGGAVELWPRSHNPRWSAPLSLTDGMDDRDETTEVQIAGKVIAAYMQFSE